MMKILLILLVFGCATLSVLAIINTIRLRSLKRNHKKIIYHTPKLSDLHGKQFSDYIDYLTRDL